MSNQTKVTDPLVSLSTGRTLDSKLLDLKSAVDYGGAIASSAAVNTVAINAAIVAATGTTGFVVLPPGMAYTEASLVIPDGVLVLAFSSSGVLRILSKDQGTAFPVLKGGIAVKSQGKTGILLRADDYGVTADPVLLVQDDTTGDIAAIQYKFAELDEQAADPSAPSANKARLFAKDNGSGSTQLAVRFPTGPTIPLATQGTSPNLSGSVVYDPGNLVDGTGVTTTVTVTGAALGDFVVVSFSVDLAGILLTGYVSAADTVSVRFQNETTGAIDLASGTIAARVLKDY